MLAGFDWTWTTDVSRSIEADAACPRELKQILLTAVAAAPGERYASIAEFHQALASYLENIWPDGRGSPGSGEDAPGARELPDIGHALRGLLTVRVLHGLHLYVENGVLPACQHIADDQGPHHPDAGLYCGYLDAEPAGVVMLA